MNTAQPATTRAAEPAALAETLGLLADVGLVPHIARVLERRIEAAREALRATIVEEIAAFSVSANPQILPELDEHADAHLHEVVRLAGGGTIGDFDFVRAHARRRAEQRFPIEATLHAYRCGHRVVSHWLRDAAATQIGGNNERAVAAIADFSIEYTNAVSTLCAAEYVARTRALAEAEGDLRSEVLGLLISGYDESDGRVARLLKRAGYLEQRQSYCVAVVQSVDPLEMESPHRTQRIVEALSAAVADTTIRALIGTRNNVVTAVFSTTRRLSGWTAPQADLAGRLRSALLVLGPAVLVGISTDQPSISFIPRAVHEASVALDFAAVSQRVVVYSELSLRRLMLHRAADYVQPALPAWVGDLARADAKCAGDLTRTLRALADSDMNVQRAARSLDLHPNTLYARLKRIQELTGLDCQRYHDLTELLLATDCSAAR